MPYRIQAKVGVQAPPAAIWAALAELEQWRDWNPLYVEAEGRMAIGAPIELVRQMGPKQDRVVATVVDWVPGEQLVWRRSIAPFARSLGYIEIEGLTEKASILAVGEIFEGLIGERIGRAERRHLRQGFEALCQALKARAEQMWDGTPDPTVIPVAPAPHKPKTAAPKPVQMSIFGRRK